MDTSEPIPIDPFELEMISNNGFIIIGILIALGFTIIYSIQNGGLREVIENVFLWFLLSFGVLNLMTYPVKEGDELTGVMAFVAFGICRIAKSMANNKEE